MNNYVSFAFLELLPRVRERNHFIQIIFIPIFFVIKYNNYNAFYLMILCVLMNFSNKTSTPWPQ